MKYLGWLKIAELGNEKAIYRHLNGQICVEQDHMYLCCPNDAELHEIEILLSVEAVR